MMKLCLFVLLVATAFFYPVELTKFQMVPANTNPGVKFSFPKKTIDYMVGQIFPWLEKKLHDMKFADIHEDCHTPIGSVEFDLTNGAITNVKIAAPTFQIISGNSIRINLADVYLQGSANWHYKEKSFPHISDSGSIDLSNLLVSISVDFGAVISSAHKSNVAIQSSNFQLGWKQFDIKVHGGASWLYNFLISQFKGNLESLISKSLEGEIPSTLVNLLQPIIDQTPFVYPLGVDNLQFSYLLEEITFSQSNSYMTFGALGAVEYGSKLPPGQAATIPDTSGDQMCQCFFSEWSFDTSGWAAQQAGLIKYVVKDSPSLPIRLNTKNFAYFIPQLASKYPNMPMQVTLKATAGTTPSFSFKSTGYYAEAKMDSIFQVVNGSSVVDAFTLEVDITMNMTVSLQKGSTAYAYDVTAKLGLDSFNMTLSKSVVGQFDAKILQGMISAIIENFALPNVNKYFLKGVPIPSTEYFQLINPTLKTYNGYFVAAFDFNFFPPPE